MSNAPKPKPFISAPGVLRAPQLSHTEFSARGGRAKTAAKLQAALRNLQKAKAAKEARRALK